MTVTEILKDIKIASSLDKLSTAIENLFDYGNIINSYAIFRKSGSQSLFSNLNKGVEFNETITISNGIVEQHDTFTFKFKIPGAYRIDYRVTVSIHENNNVPNIYIIPSVSSTLTASGEFLNYSDFGIITTRKRVQTSSNVDKLSPHAVDSIYDSCIYVYDGTPEIYFKLLAWGPNTADSYINSDATLTFTYLSF